ncbi:MAG: ABC transporter ATP-binding protein [Tissierellia bacterium]|nr:ABC transporter ATP-binding protein [Tissierellia bacterium]
MKWIKNNGRALVIISKQSPTWLISTSIYAILQGIFPLFGIYITAKIIDELVLFNNYEKIRFWVLVLILGTSLIQGMMQISKRVHNVSKEDLRLKLAQLLSNKTMNFDYSEFDQGERMNLYSQILQDENLSGWGLFQVMDYYESILFQWTKVVTALSMSYSLFTKKVSLESLQFINHKIFSIAFIFLLILFMGLSGFAVHNGLQFWLKAGDQGKLVNRKFRFLYKTLYDREKDMDLRIYDQSEHFSKIAKSNIVYMPDGLMGKYGKKQMGFALTVSPFFNGLALILTYIYVGTKAYGGAFEIGSLTQYVGALYTFYSGFAEALNRSSYMMANSEYLERIYRYLDWKNPMYRGSLTVEKRLDRKYEVEVKNLSFKYPGSEEYVLKNVNFKFRIGERLAIVGPNGSGKTTFIKLLCRLYDPTEGEILLNGIDIRKYDYREYMDLFSVVFQDFKLFAVPLKENIALDHPWEEERMVDVLEKVGFVERFSTMKNGFDTMIYKDLDDEGVDLSGGEAQKIALARALYQEKPFLILDEPTAALDPIAEYEIYRRLQEIISDRTAIFISHRLSSCRFSDRIAVFDNGEVSEVGHHEDLMERKGLYYDLWTAQAQYYNEEEKEKLL